MVKLSSSLLAGRPNLWHNFFRRKYRHECAGKIFHCGCTWEDYVCDEQWPRGDGWCAWRIRDIYLIDWKLWHWAIIGSLQDFSLDRFVVSMIMVLDECVLSVVVVFVVADVRGWHHSLLFGLYDSISLEFFFYRNLRLLSRSILQRIEMECWPDEWHLLNDLAHNQYTSLIQTTFYIHIIFFSVQQNVQNEFHASIAL